MGVKLRPKAGFSLGRLVTLWEESQSRCNPCMEVPGGAQRVCQGDFLVQMQA